MVEPKHNAMKGISPYGTELNKEDLDSKRHREFVGGLWEEVGQLQFDFMKKQGLLPNHSLFDIGCGSLRGGLHFIAYLEPGNYCGLDVNASLIDAGFVEIEEAQLADRKANLLVDDQFRFEKFGRKFDYMISISVFTHLPMNIIIRCLTEASNHLKQTGVYFSTFFEAPTPAHLNELVQWPGGVTTYYDSDPFHYSFAEISWMADIAGLQVEAIADWEHPRNQKMLAFRIKD